MRRLHYYALKFKNAGARGIITGIVSKNAESLNETDAVSAQTKK
jgi:hypothetical protein